MHASLWLHVPGAAGPDCYADGRSYGYWSVLHVDNPDDVARVIEQLCHVATRSLTRAIPKPGLIFWKSRYRSTPQAGVAAGESIDVAGCYSANRYVTRATSKPGLLCCIHNVRCPSCSDDDSLAAGECNVVRWRHCGGHAGYGTNLAHAVCKNVPIKAKQRTNLQGLVRCFYYQKWCRRDESNTRPSHYE